MSIAGIVIVQVTGGAALTLDDSVINYQIDKGHHFGRPFLSLDVSFFDRGSKLKPVHAAPPR